MLPEIGVGMAGNGNRNDLMGVGMEWEQESHYRTPLLEIMLPVISTGVV